MRKLLVALVLVPLAVLGVYSLAISRDRVPPEPRSRSIAIVGADIYDLNHRIDGFLKERGVEAVSVSITPRGNGFLEYFAILIYKE